MAAPIPSMHTYRQELRDFPRFLPGGDEYRGGALPPELEDGVFTVHEPTTVGWDENCLPNETLDAAGNLPKDEERGFGQADMSPSGVAIARRSPDDPGVIALRNHLEQNAGIVGA